jgi:predicted O-linked N-acetylglucosamine transferase (SPINDLY family)
VFEHIDEGLFRRVGLPEWTIAQTPEDYIQAAVRLATDYEARVVLYQHLATSDPLGTLFSGRAHALSEALLHELR